MNIQIELITDFISLIDSELSAKEYYIHHSFRIDRDGLKEQRIQEIGELEDLRNKLEKLYKEKIQEIING